MDFDYVIENLEDIYEMLYYGLGIAELGVSGVVLFYGIIAALVTALFGMAVSFLLFVLESVPLFKISRKMSRKSAYLVWLSWLPVIGGYISTYVLVDVPGDKPLKLTENLTVQNRFFSFWIRIGIGVFGTTLITVLIGIINLFPVLGQVVGAGATLLYLLPTAAIAWMECIYLKDVLDLFNPDQKSNLKAAIIIAVLDVLVTKGFARAFYLYTVMNKEPLPKTEYPQEIGAVSVSV